MARILVTISLSPEIANKLRDENNYSTLISRLLVDYWNNINDKQEKTTDDHFETLKKLEKSYIDQVNKIKDQILQEQEKDRQKALIKEKEQKRKEESEKLKRAIMEELNATES